MAGRPRKPTALKRLQGTLQKCRTNPHEPIPEVDLKCVPPPDYLTESAKEIWNFSLQAAPQKMLSSLDYGIFTEWVVCFDQFVKLSACIKEQGTFTKDGDGNVKVSDLLHHITKTAGILRGLQNELGFTPASRSKVVSFGAKNDGKKNKFEEIE